jgi:hypothetical protein
MTSFIRSLCFAAAGFAPARISTALAANLCEVSKETLLMGDSMGEGCRHVIVVESAASICQIAEASTKLDKVKIFIGDVKEMYATRRVRGLLVCCCR